MANFWRWCRYVALTLHPVRAVTLGYLAYVAAGALLLSLPWSHAAKPVSVLDALFTSTSAVSTTGLTTVSTGNDFNAFGQATILVLIQVGGIGYMTFGSFVILSTSGTLSRRRRHIGQTVFNMPREFRIDKFVRSVIAFTALAELLGACALYAALVRAGAASPLWSAVFHSVSAFCTAGFSLYDSSFVSLRGDFWVNLILGVLSYCGAIGFIVFVDAWRSLTHKTVELTLTSKVILVTTAWVSAAGFVLFFVGEPSIRAFPLGERVMAAAFQVMTAITTVGFNTIDTGALSQSSLFLIILLMSIGASPSGTGGGLKTTTFSAVIGVIRSAIAGRDKVTFWGRVIPAERIWAAMASLGFYLMTLIAGSYLLALTESFGFENLAFEAASALGTVGLSTGITAGLTKLGKAIVILLMFIGRMGPLAFGMAIFLPSQAEPAKGGEDLAT